jgi:hypothetical protein
MPLRNEGRNLDPFAMQLSGRNQERKQLTFRLPGFPPEIGCCNKFKDGGTGLERLNLLAPSAAFVT